ncbi:hypothetical protein F4678DRAFT_477502 [Xylaria arbuscula]|nr:hypothetical protein F4678DRAFT_477502 [Xylaria arbuscula]
MASPSWDARRAGSQHPEPPSQPTLYPLYVDNNRYDGGPASTFPTGFLPPLLPISEPTNPPYPSSNPPMSEGHYRMDPSQPLDRRTIVHNGSSCYASDAYGTVGMPHPPPASGITGQQSGMLDQTDANNTSTRQACDYCRRLNIKCDKEASCTRCQQDGMDCERGGLKIYNVMLGQTAKIDDRQSAEDIRPCSLYGCPRPAQPTTEHLSCLPGRSAYSSTEASEDEQDRLILHSTPAHIPIAHSSDIERLALQDEAEWDAAILWLYIEKYYEAAVHNNSIMPRDLLDNMVHQFLIDRECWDKRSGADINTSIVFLVLSIGKMYAERQSASSIPSCQPIGPDQSTKVPGFAFFKLGRN